MPGIFDKVKEKKAEFDRKQQEGKVKDIQNQIDKRSADFKKDLEKGLRKMGLSPSYVDLWGANALQRNAGTIVARFTDKEGYPITLVQTQQVYEGTPWGASFEKRLVYFGASIWGTVLQVPIPYTLLFKTVEKGFMKGKDRVFLPLTSMPFNEKELLTDPRLQDPLPAVLNADKKLVESIDNNMWEATVLNLTHKCTMTVSLSDVGGRCLIIPAEAETCIFLRTHGWNGGNTLSNLDKYLEIMSTIRRHVHAHPHAERVSGKIPSPLFNTVYTLCRAESPKPSAEAVF